MMKGGMDKLGMAQSKDAKMAGLGNMLESKFKTFDEKVAFVKQNMPNMKDPAALVAAALRAAGKM